MELKSYLNILRRWSWIAVLCVVVASSASYWVASQQPPVYEAKARYLIGPAITNPNVDSGMLRATAQLGQTYAEIATSRPLLQDVIDQLKLNTDVNTVASIVDATWIEGTMILTIRARAAEPQTAALIANAIGDALIARSPGGPASLQSAQREYAREQIEKLQATIEATQQEIDEVSNQIQQASDDLTQRRLIVRLDSRRAQLATAQRALSDQYSILQSSSANQIAVVEAAVPQSTPIAPQVSRSVIVAAMAGLVLGVLIMLLLEFGTDVIRVPEELRKATGLAYLGGIARHKRLRGPDTAQLVVYARPETLAAESYRILRANLQKPSTHRALSSVLVTSPARGDGKSEVAANLAISFAQAGKSVILIDGNLRRPRLAALFGLSGEHGLSELLHPGVELPQPQLVPSFANLMVLPAGTPTPAASEILASERMRQLLDACTARADIVILDSPPLVYSDALALAPCVDGVLLVAKSGSTSRQNLVSAVESLQLVGAKVLGTVLNQVKPGPAYSYYPMHAGKPAAPSFGQPKGNLAVEYSALRNEQAERVN